MAIAGKYKQAAHTCLPGAFAITVALWIFGGSIGVNAVAAATVGLTILLVANVVSWKVRGSCRMLGTGAWGTWPQQNA
jgi:di/tricarboxylate transporter